MEIRRATERDAPAIRALIDLYVADGSSIRKVAISSGAVTTLSGSPNVNGHADGTASQALADRVRTACELYDQGFAPRLIFSGGPGDGPVSEPRAMRALAVLAGVPDAAITLDEAGLNTDATVTDTAPVIRGSGTSRAMVVSHAYHLPRVKMAYGRAGLDVYTVPARQTYPLRNMPKYVCREVVALWAYYVRPLI